MKRHLKVCVKLARADNFPVGLFTGDYVRCELEVYNLSTPIHPSIPLLLTKLCVPFPNLQECRHNNILELKTL